MKRVIQSALMAVFLALGAVSAQAMSFTVGATYDPLNESTTLSGSNAAFDGSFSILAAGYVPSTMDLKSATATFKFQNITSGEIAQIRFRFLTGTPNFEFVLAPDGGPLSGGSWGLGDVVFSLPSTGPAFAKLDSTGVLDFRVNRDSGTFKFLSGELAVVTPDGGTTALLLGCGLLGLIVVQRRLAARAA